MGFQTCSLAFELLLPKTRKSHLTNGCMENNSLERRVLLVKLSWVLLVWKTSRKVQQNGCLSFFLGKTANDMYILARGSSVRLSKSIKRIFPEWFRHIDLYRGLQVQSWMIEGTLGTRIKLSPLKPPGRAAIEAGGDQSPDEAGSDPESIEGLGVDLSDDTPLVFLNPAVATVPGDVVQSMPVDGSGVSEPVVPEAATDEPPMKRLKVGTSGYGSCR